MEKTAISLAIEEFNFVCDPSRNSEYTIEVIKWCIQQLENRCLELEKKQLIEARLDGFKLSGEGFNGEYPFEGCLDKKIHEAIDNEQYYTTKFNK